MQLYFRQQLDEDTVEYIIHPDIINYIQKYFELDFYGTKVEAPYFINTKRRKDLRALVGKGTPEEMILETKVWAQVKGLDLTTASPAEIRNLMLKVGIGIDCSGLILHSLINFFKLQRQGSLLAKLEFPDKGVKSKIARLLKPVENVNANTLTSELNCDIVPFNEIRPGDFLRGVGKQRNAYHIALVTKVTSKLTPQEKEEVDVIDYIHSHRGYGLDNGVRRGRLRIVDAQAGVEEQQWMELHSDGVNYLLEMDIKPYPQDSGFRRLKFLK